MGEEGGGLGKEDGKGSEGGILDGILDVLASPGIGQLVKKVVEAVDQGSKAS